MGHSRILLADRNLADRNRNYSKSTSRDVVNHYSVVISFRIISFSPSFFSKRFSDDCAVEFFAENVDFYPEPDRLFARFVFPTESAGGGRANTLIDSIAEWLAKVRVANC
jgi:hypothetical protein